MRAATPRSLDGGSSWTALGVTSKTPTNPNGFQPTMDLMAGQAWYNQLILIDRAHANTIYFGGQLATAKSTDGGTTWTLISDWLPGFFPTLPYVHADCHAATAITLNGQTAIIFGTDGGIFFSTDGGGSFAFDKNDGIVSMLAQTVISSAKNPPTFISGMQDMGTRARLASSRVYNQVTGGDGEGVGWTQANNAVTITTAAFGQVFRSSGLLPNTFGTWTRVTPPGAGGAILHEDGHTFGDHRSNRSDLSDRNGKPGLFHTGWCAVEHVLEGSAQNGRRGRLRDFLVRDNYHGIALEAADPQFNRIARGGINGRIAHLSRRRNTLDHPGSVFDRTGLCVHRLACLDRERRFVHCVGKS